MLETVKASPDFFYELLPGSATVTMSHVVEGRVNAALTTHAGPPQKPHGKCYHGGGERVNWLIA